FKPSPKERRSRIVTVPQAIDAIVSVARFFWRRAEPRNKCATTEMSRRVMAGSCSELHRHDGVQTRGVAGREVPGEEPGDAEDEGRQRRDGERDLRIPDEVRGAELREDAADAPGDREADRAADRGDQERLEEELAENPPLPRAERHLDPD